MVHNYLTFANIVSLFSSVKYVFCVTSKRIVTFLGKRVRLPTWVVDLSGKTHIPKKNMDIVQDFVEKSQQRRRILEIVENFVLNMSHVFLFLFLIFVFSIFFHFHFFSVSGKSSVRAVFLFQAHLSQRERVGRMIKCYGEM